MENKLKWTLLMPQKVGAKVEMYMYFKNPNLQCFERPESKKWLLF